MITTVLFVIGGACLFFVYFFLGYRIMTLYDRLRRPVPSPPPMVMTTRLTLALGKIFRMNLDVEPKTKEERAIVEEIKKTVKAARILLIVAVLAFLLAYLVPKII